MTSGSGSRKVKSRANALAQYQQRNRKSSNDFSDIRNPQLRSRLQASAQYLGNRSSGRSGRSSRTTKGKSGSKSKTSNKTKKNNNTKKTSKKVNRTKSKAKNNSSNKTKNNSKTNKTKRLSAKEQKRRARQRWSTRQYQAEDRLRDIANEMLNDAPGFYKATFPNKREARRFYRNQINNNRFQPNLRYMSKERKQDMLDYAMRNTRISRG